MGAGAGLTTPAPVLAEAPHVTVTGNLSVSMPSIDLVDASVGSLGVLSVNHLGLLSATGSGGAPLLTPSLEVDGTDVLAAAPRWRREAHWIPVARWEAVAPGLAQAWFLAPHDHAGSERGVVCRLSYRHDGEATASVRIGWAVAWDATELSQFRRRPVGAAVTTAPDPWTGSVVHELATELPVLALGVQRVLDDGDGPGTPLSGGEATDVRVARGETVHLDLFVAVAPEPDGAATGRCTCAAGASTTWRGPPGHGSSPMGCPVRPVDAGTACTSTSTSTSSSPRATASTPATRSS